MKASKHLLIFGLVGFTVFYLIASGCATFDYGGFKQKTEGKIVRISNKEIKTVYLDFISEYKNSEFENDFKSRLFSQYYSGYKIAESAYASDVKLQVEYTLLSKKKKHEVDIFFLIPFFNSYDVEGVEAKATYETDNGSFEKTYYGEREMIIYDITMDLKKIGIK